MLNSAKPLCSQLRFISPKGQIKTSPGGWVPGTPGTSPSRGTCDIMGGASQGSPPELWCLDLLGGASRRQAWLPMSVTLASSPCRGLLDTRDPEVPPINPIISQTPWHGLEQVDEDAFISRTSLVSRGPPPGAEPRAWPPLGVQGVGNLSLLS